MSIVENLTTELGDMNKKSQSMRQIPISAWTNAIRLSHQLKNNFQNMNTVLSAAHGSGDNKVEAFDLKKTIMDLSSEVILSLTDHEVDVDFSHEAGIPDTVFGNYHKFKQIVTILLTLGLNQANAERPMGCHLRFLRMDENKNYIIGIEVVFPKGDKINLEKLNKILSNTALDPDFFFEFKEELQIYDLGIFVLGHLTNEDGDKIKANQKEDNVIEISLEMSFSLLNRGNNILLMFS